MGIAGGLLAAGLGVDHLVVGDGHDLAFLHGDDGVGAALHQEIDGGLAQRARVLDIVGGAAGAAGCSASTLARTRFTALTIQKITSASRTKLMRTVTKLPQARTTPAFCAGCALERSCAGGCKADAYSRYGSLAMPDPYLERHRAEARKIPPKEAV